MYIDQHENGRGKDRKWAHDSAALQKQEHSHTAPLAGLQEGHDACAGREAGLSQGKGVDEPEEAEIATSYVFRQRDNIYSSSLID